MQTTAQTIEQAVDRAYRTPGQTIRVRETWSAEYVPIEWADVDRGLVARGALNVRHYGTLVLQIADLGTGTLNVTLGAGAWGSVSDQGGVNRVLAHLGLDYRASRAGGGFALMSRAEHEAQYRRADRAAGIAISR